MRVTISVASQGASSHVTAAGAIDYTVELGCADRKVAGEVTLCPGQASNKLVTWGELRNWIPDSLIVACEGTEGSDLLDAIAAACAACDREDGSTHETEANVDAGPAWDTGAAGGVDEAIELAKDLDVDGIDAILRTGYDDSAAINADAAGFDHVSPLWRTVYYAGWVHGATLELRDQRVAKREQIVVVDTDDTRPVVTGMGATEDAAREDAEQSGCVSDEATTLRVPGVIADMIREGTVDCESLGITVAISRSSGEITATIGRYYNRDEDCEGTLAEMFPDGGVDTEVARLAVGTSMVWGGGAAPVVTLDRIA